MSEVKFQRTPETILDEQTGQRHMTGRMLIHDEYGTEVTADQMRQAEILGQRDIALAPVEAAADTAGFAFRGDRRTLVAKEDRAEAPVEVPAEPVAAESFSPTPQKVALPESDPVASVEDSPLITGAE